LGSAVPGHAVAQTAKDLVGTWKTVTTIAIGPDGHRSEPWPESECYIGIRR
jgi:hypothetical protein